MSDSSSSDKTNNTTNEGSMSHFKTSTPTDTTRRMRHQNTTAGHLPIDLPISPVAKTVSFAFPDPGSINTRRIRQSSGPAQISVGPPKSPIPVTRKQFVFGASSSKPPTPTFSQSRSSRPSIGKKNDAGGNSTIFAKPKTTQKQNQLYKDMKLEPETVAKVLSQITKSDAKDLHDAKLQDLVTTCSLKRGRNLFQQFETDDTSSVPHPMLQRFEDDCDFYLKALSESAASLGAHALENGPSDAPVAGNAAVRITVEHHPPEREYLVEQLGQANGEWIQKYEQTLKDDYMAKRNELLNPRVLEETTSNLIKLNRTIKSITSGRSNTIKFMRLLDEKETPDGIPCPVEDRGRFVETVGNLDRLLVDQESFSKLSSLNFNKMLLEQSGTLENSMERLGTLQQEIGQNDQLLVSRIQQLKNLETRMLKIEQIGEKVYSEPEKK